MYGDVMCFKWFNYGGILRKNSQNREMGGLEEIERMERMERREEVR